MNRHGCQHLRLFRVILVAISMQSFALGMLSFHTRHNICTPKSTLFLIGFQPTWKWVCTQVPARVVLVLWRQEKHLSSTVAIASQLSGP